MQTINDIFNAGRAITRMSAEDYGTYWQGYRDDSNRRRNQRRAVNAFMKRHVMDWEMIVPPGRYGRITVSDNGVSYCAGQYAPTEYYFYVLEVCRCMYQRREALAAA